MSEFAEAQYALRFAAVNDLYPDLVTAHLVDVPRDNRFDITAYFNMDGESMRLDACVDYADLVESDDLLGLIIKIIDVHVQKYKEKNK